MIVERWNKDADTENQNSVKEVCPSSTLSITNPTLTALGWKPVLLSTRLVTKHLTHGTIRQQLGIGYDMQLYATFKISFHIHKDSPGSGTF
jgi:hypothetical protein